MKRISLLFTTFIFIFLNLNAQTGKIFSTVEVTVTNMKKEPSKGDKLFFVSEKDKKVYTCVSDKAGKCKIELPNGETFQIKIKSFEDASNYTAVEIADKDYPMNLNLTVMYELPKTYTLKNVEFATGSYNLKPSSYKSLNDLAELMLLKDSLKFELAGYTDNVGNDDDNQKLSEMRAKTVRNYLIKKGVSANRLKAIGYGKNFPVADNSTPEGRRKNRRTEIHIFD